MFRGRLSQQQQQQHQQQQQQQEQQQQQPQQRPRKERSSSSRHCIFGSTLPVALSRTKAKAVLLLVILVVLMIVFRTDDDDNNNNNNENYQYLKYHHYNDWFHLLSTSTGPSTIGTRTSTSTATMTKVDSDQSSHQDDHHHHHRVAGLSCASFGGPTSRAAEEEMIYWYNIPSDTNQYHSYKRNSPTDDEENEKEEEERYLTFEPDEGGWNNIRMALETTVAVAVSMRRTLVLPPSMTYYLLWKDEKRHKNNVMNFHHFYHLESIQNEYKDVVRIIPMEEFLNRMGMTGQLRSRQSGHVRLPNRTDWSTGTKMYNFESVRQDGTHSKELWEYIRDVAQPITWESDTCVVVFPDVPSDKTDATQQKEQEHDRLLQQHLQQVLQNDQMKYGSQQKRHQRIQLHRLRQDSYRHHPTPVNATTTERLAEILGHRKQLCIYNATQYHQQQYKVVHMTGSSTDQNQVSTRFLIHFYAFLFYENYHTDLFIKRFIRDHLRYIDEIQCGAARIIEAIRNIARSNHNQYTNSTEATVKQQQQYDSFHIRRGDFQYKLMHLSATEIYEGTTRDVVPDGRTVYIATDELNSTFFNTFQQHYNVLFLHNFTHLIPDINHNYYGMIDQLVASKGEVFVGAFFSTFSGYINRLRGYHAQKQKFNGYEMGRINSYYYVPESHANVRNIMQSYTSVQQSYWQQEFPTAWRDINHDVTEDMIIPD